MDEDLKYKLALALIPGITARMVVDLAEAGITPRDFFTLGLSELGRVVNEFIFSDDVRVCALDRAGYELDFIHRHKIRTLFITDEDYPRLVAEADDAPVMLFVLGNANLSATPSISLVGTRRCTSYGVNFCKDFVAGISGLLPEASIISGLAYGIDAAAHNAALDNSLQTVAVVAHGLDMIYPAAHRDLARRIIDAGGAIISEYPCGVKPLQRNFLRRNRIVAALSELTVVAESEVRGGAMSTANLAFSYNREVMAVPGRVTDKSSSGCNALIAREKARIYTSVPETIKLMRWHPVVSGTKAVISRQLNLFPELEGDAALIYNHLRAKATSQSIDELHDATGLAMPVLMSTLAELEFDGILNRLPGSRYEVS